MKYGSVCSGIGTDALAFHPLGWGTAWFAEIEAFPSAVLAYHFSDVPNLGDFKQIGEEHGPIDVLCGGTPCQSFSVAGKRLGLDDPRGNLAIEFLRLAKRVRARWILWENVPGVLSSSSGRDFHAFLSLLGECGYGYAYRVLDARYFGVPQRRRRVFVIGYFGDWRPPFAVLSERHSLSRHTPPSLRSGQSAAATITGGFGERGVDADQIANGNFAIGIEIGPSGGRTTDVSPTLDARAKDGPRRNQLAPPVLTDMAGGANGQAIAIDLTNGPVGEVGGTLEAAQARLNRGQATLSPSSRVRRLTPKETERLQGLPDNWTLIPYRGKPAADGPRYRAIGNGWALPVAAWVGKRIDMVDRLLATLRQ